MVLTIHRPRDTVEKDAVSVYRTVDDMGQTLHSVHVVKTTIDIDDKLTSEAMRKSGARTKKDAIELALKELVQLRNRKALADAFGSQPEIAEIPSRRGR